MKSQPPTDLRNVPVLTQAVHLNPSLRAAVLPWHSSLPVPETLDTASLDQHVLADKVIEQVQEKIAELMPELLKESVDQVLREHALEQSRANTNDSPEFKGTVAKG